MVTVDLLIGTHFDGFSSPYTPDEIAAFGLIDAAGNAEITGRFGDMPAGQFVVAQVGLSLLYHQTTPSYVTYTKPENSSALRLKKGLLMSRHVIRSRRLKIFGWLKNIVGLPKA